MVALEGRGLDIAIEIHVRGDRMKDVDRNVKRYAHLGIPEYFTYEVLAGRLCGYRLPSAGSTAY